MRFIWRGLMLHGMFDKENPPAWHNRLVAAIARAKAQGRSLADISRAAGKEPSYASEIGRKKSDPSVSTFLALVETLDVSVNSILFGINITPEQERIMSMLADLDDETLTEVETVVRSMLRVAR